jgi:hypothetical protein
MRVFVISPIKLKKKKIITGGSLTAWGVTQTKTRYKVAVVGAGATHWETMVTESASPELEVRIYTHL